MRFRFLTAPAAVAAALAANPAGATNFLTLPEAQQLIFPGARFTPADIVLTDAQADTLARVSGTTVYRNQLKIWKASTGGWFFLDQVPGRDDRITYALGVNPDGSVKAMEVLVCLSEYDQVRGNWRKAFIGKRYSRAHLSKTIPSISGATFSVEHLTDGVTRILAAYALFVAPKQG